jgi:phosphonate transport system permease protein
MSSSPSNAGRWCVSCLIAWGLLLAAVAGSFVYLELPLGDLFSAQAASDIARFFASFFPPDTSPDFLSRVGLATLETLAISAVGTLLAALAGLALALPAAGRFGPWARPAFRFLLNALRSVPELVWATLLVLAAGLGPFAGTLALAVHTTGVLGRLFAEALENVPAEPRNALELAGASPALAFLYGTWPLILPQLVAYTLYRWEMNIRMAAILGFVGAGGLGQMLYFELSLFHQAQACTVILAMLGLTILVDAASTACRKGLATAAS